MCGISGYILEKNTYLNSKNVLDNVKHRGPDDNNEISLIIRN